MSSFSPEWLKERADEIDRAKQSLLKGHVIPAAARLMEIANELVAALDDTGQPKKDKGH